MLHFARHFHGIADGEDGTVARKILELHKIGVFHRAIHLARHFVRHFTRKMLRNFRIHAPTCARGGTENWDRSKCGRCESYGGSLSHDLYRGTFRTGER